MWSLATEQKKGIDAFSSNVATPQAIDSNYLSDLYGPVVSNLKCREELKKVAFGIAAENPQLLYSTALAADAPYAVSVVLAQTAATTTPQRNGCATATLTANPTTGVGHQLTTCSYLATLSSTTHLTSSESRIRSGLRCTTKFLVSPALLTKRSTREKTRQRTFTAASGVRAVP